jgi:Ser/Thr protein kinase RdoA (MazF antagonist)
VELLAEGRMAQVFALDDDRVLKLDRAEWSGVCEFEFDVINRVAAAGLPVARAHEILAVDGRKGVVLDRVYGTSLQADLSKASEEQIDELALVFARLQATINSTTVSGLPDLVTRLGAEIERSGLATERVVELTELLGSLDDGHRGICHFDLHPNNVIVSPQGWVVIDWLTVGRGPALADVARTLVLRGQEVDAPLTGFMRRVRHHSLRLHEAAARVGIGARAAAGDLDAWVRIVAGARLAEGFDGAYAEWLKEVADGAIRLT